MLHSLLLQNSDEFGDPHPEAVRRLVADTRLQVGLLACAAELVLYAANGQPSFPALTQRLEVLGCVLEMWEGLKHTQHVLLQASPSPSTFFTLASAAKTYTKCCFCLMTSHPVIHGAWHATSQQSMTSIEHAK